MAAKNKRPNRAQPREGNSNPDVRHIFALHVEGSQTRDLLLEEARQLHAAGKIREARLRLKSAEAIQQCLRALEDECRSRPAPILD